jgi:hypothetical protein
MSTPNASPDFVSLAARIDACIARSSLLCLPPAAPEGWVTEDGSGGEAHFSFTRKGGWVVRVYLETKDDERSGFFTGKGATPEEATEDLVEEIRAAY